jgi:hypothetical protein
MNKWKVLDATFLDPDLAEEVKVFDPHPAQLEMAESPARYKVASCGRRLGKSNWGGHELVPWAIQAKVEAAALAAQGRRREFWIVGPEYADSEKEFRVFYDKAKKLGMPFDRPGTYYSVQTGDMSVSLWDGAFILKAKSEARPTSLVGEALSGVIMAEAAKMKENTWLQYIMPSLSDFLGWAIFTTTPEGKNWFYRLYLDAIKKGNPAWNGWRMPSWRNPYVYTATGRDIAMGRVNKTLADIPQSEVTVDAHVKRLLQLMSDNPQYSAFEIITSEGLIIDPEVAQAANDNTIPMFTQEYAADFTDFVGKVFKEFDEETHSRLLPYNPGWETVAAVDYGYRNPNVWLLIQIGPYGEINIIDELYQENLAPDEFAQEILRRGLCPDTCSAFYPDPALPGYTKTLENIFRRNGRRAIARSHTGGELQDRLNLIRLALKDRITDTELSTPQWQSHPPKPDHRRPRLMISTRCPKTLYEFGEYRYPEKKDEQQETSTKRFELPMKKDDHTPEALGRMLASRYHDMAAQYGGGTRVSKARFLQSMGSTRFNHAGGYADVPAGVPSRHTHKVRGTWMSGR